ncbi:MAG: kynureninase [Lysobacterales bacterium CG17_big_fil_post_rev_8_21_14_2_50_64_11]|nr:MAG: kynureninase [Xanthomonadales bacterium CG17_big_fil_post_rev_8_21_14_2_50_64_11]PIX60159.1 MAG: kynureninase [Xanthomonadales bacterium CG_4_10_14_3_um_filter_64_11]
MSTRFSEAHALVLDAADPLRAMRDEFALPRHGDDEQIYLCGNSLGLMPYAARDAVNEELDAWAQRAVEGHFHGPRPWLHTLDSIREPLAQLVGAQPLEVVAMNTLTVNLHLLLASFYRPHGTRCKLLIEAGAFPSDQQAVVSQLQWHGLDPASALIVLQPDLADGLYSRDAITAAIAEHGDTLALVLLPGVQYRTGQVLDIAAITASAHAAGAIAGFDLAHAAGNVPLALHDSGADFAVWCSYKYLNAGPGAIAGAFVHQRHAHSGQPRLAGWWGHEQATRFAMAPEFTPSPGAEGWQLSNPPILSLAPLRATLAQFQRAGFAALRNKSVQLTGYLETLIREQLDDTLQILTPADPQQRGCQLSLRVRAGRAQGRDLFAYLLAHGIVGDWREPDVIRLSPTPLYNRYLDVLRAVVAIAQWRART